MSSLAGSGAPRTLDVLPSHASRRLTRRDGLLPMVLALELLAGVAFGLAGHAGSEATSVSAKLTLGSPATTRLAPSHLVSRVTAGLPAALPVQGPVAAERTGPAIGPLLPGTVRSPLPVEAVATAAAIELTPPVDTPPAALPTSYPTHAPRDPFAALVHASTL
jgi:hypothetical protein